uniref:Uncharacterized protein n=2 Tax=Phaeomonas parva TaxID=124430 RepID=A0A7S1U5L2_9STRA|mmetsp:Transcript_31549/g.100126  ORF Transcript_31549/g.100126 Transcript_31549/m.100126 type:complete len:155 (+) Transcript_31549:242-706(+)
MLSGNLASAHLRAKASTLTTRGSEEPPEWSNSEASFMSSSTAPTAYGSGSPVLRLTEDNLLRYERLYQYRSGNNNAIKKLLFQRLLEDSIRFSQMEPEPIPEEYLALRRERSSSRSDRSQKTATSGSIGSTTVGASTSKPEPQPPPPLPSLVRG